MTRFELALAQLKAERENFDEMVYVTGYASLAEYVSERNADLIETHEEFLEHVDSLEQLAAPFIVIDQPTSSLFEVVTSEQINDNQNVIVYYEPNQFEIEVLGEIDTNKSISVEDALDILDLDVEDYDYGAIKLLY